jgi:hypothetical protein
MPTRRPASTTAAPRSTRRAACAFPTASPPTAGPTSATCRCTARQRRRPVRALQLPHHAAGGQPHLRQLPSRPPDVQRARRREPQPRPLQREAARCRQGPGPHRTSTRLRARVAGLRTSTTSGRCWRPSQRSPENLLACPAWASTTSRGSSLAPRPARTSRERRPAAARPDSVSNGGATAHHRAQRRHRLLRQRQLRRPAARERARRRTRASTTRVHDERRLVLRQGLRRRC